MTEDYDADGKISEEEINMEITEEKAESQKWLAIVALAAMIIVTLLSYMPFIPDARIVSLAAIVDVFYISCAGVVGAYMGMTAWIARKK
jgi:hypothetical protein